MACLPTDVMKVAEALQSIPNAANDSVPRSAISRAYYAAFLHTRNKAGITEMSGAVHQMTIDFCYNVGCNKIAQKLDNLRLERNRADYDLHRHFNQVLAGQQIKRAYDIINAIDKVVP
jgi:uncharacterized protein (UPF0332 family)